MTVLVPELVRCSLCAPSRPSLVEDTALWTSSISFPLIPPPSETITPSSLPSSFLRLPPPSSLLEGHPEVRRPGRGGQCSCHAGSSGVEQDVLHNHFGRRSRVWPSFSRSCLPPFIDEIDVQPPARDTGFPSYAICRWESSSMYRYVPHANVHSP
jgi:hypothetical protein